MMFESVYLLIYCTYVGYLLIIAQSTDRPTCTLYYDLSERELKYVLHPSHLCQCKTLQLNESFSFNRAYSSAGVHVWSRNAERSNSRQTHLSLLQLESRPPSCKCQVTFPCRGRPHRRLVGKIQQWEAVSSSKLWQMGQDHSSFPSGQTRRQPVGEEVHSVIQLRWSLLQTLFTEQQTCGKYHVIYTNMYIFQKNADIHVSV